MRLRFLGAARTVTGSMHHVEANGRRILLDTGLYQGKRKEARARNGSFPFEPSSIDAVVLSHAHIDHSGNLPTLVKGGFRGPIYATPATRDLCALMLPDSAHIQEKDAEYLGRQGKEAVPPLYAAADAAAALAQFVSVPAGRPFAIGPGLQATHHEGGHMLGAGGVLVEAEEAGRTVRLGFSGDIGHAGDPLLRDVRAVPDPEVLILESTYGDKRHPPSDERAEQLLAVIERTVRRGGKMVVPAFSVGRTQVLVYTLNRLFNAGRLPPVPIFVDSPLSVNATDVFRRHADELNPEIRVELARERDDDPFGFSRLAYIRNVEESKALNDRPGPFVIISASGMCESGRVVHHLRNALGDARNTVLIVGFQAPHTLGARLVQRVPFVNLLGAAVPCRAEVVELHGFSAHADQPELAAYAKACNAGGRLKRIFLVHGEPGPMDALAGVLKEQGLPEVRAPARGETEEV